jgi:hypothetical protein
VGRGPLFLLGFDLSYTAKKRTLFMDKVEIIKSEVEKFPEPLLDEVLDFVHFLKGKIISGKMATAFASESSLTKDWLRPEEDEAWQNL